MFKTKSFDLINEDELKKRDNLYDSERCRWMSFVVIPVSIGFILLLILVNVDFTGTAYVMTTTTTTIVTDATTLQTSTPALTTILQFEGDKKKDSTQRNIDSDYHDANAKISLGGADCKIEDNNPCQISCTGDVSNVKKKLEAQQKSCIDNTLEVILYKCKFPSGDMDSDFLKGSFYLNSLKISDCNLKHIWPYPFTQSSVAQTLKTLIFENTQFTYLDDNRLKGLQSIIYFRFEDKNYDFLGTNFLSPIARTLNETKLLQYTNKKFNPANWFGYSNFENLLYVDLSSNYFTDTLRNTTFEKFVKVQQLILSKCDIYAMESGTFDTIMKTLLYLDLSNNQLTKLSGDFLSYSGNNLKIDLSFNMWECTCDNNELNKYIQSSEFAPQDEPKCTTPEKWQEHQSPTTLEPQNTPTCPGITTQNDTDTDTGDNSDTSETTETTEDINTTPDTTTPIPINNAINILCRDYVEYTAFNQTIRNYDALFYIYSESSTSVVIFILNDMSKLRLIYFIPKKYFNSQYTNQSAKVTSRKCERVVTTTIVHIQGLIKNQTYVFCLVPHDEKRISPFNCRSHQLEDPKDFSESWLHINDIAWMVPVIGVGIVVCVIFGSCALFWLLRWRPTWLFGSKRLIRMGCKPHEMLLLPKADRTSLKNQYLSDLVIHDPERYLAVNSNMQFYKNEEIFKLKKMEYLPENLPPLDPAPAIPSYNSRTVSLQSTIIADDLMQQCNMDDFDNDYQSLSHYQHIG